MDACFSPVVLTIVTGLLATLSSAVALLQRQLIAELRGRRDDETRRANRAEERIDRLLRISTKAVDHALDTGTTGAHV